MSAWRQVENAIKRISEGHAALISHAETPWNSATFGGTKHTLTLRFDGDEAVNIGLAMLEELPRHDLRLGRHVLCETEILWRNLLEAPSLSLVTQLRLTLLANHKEAA